ncbi:MAG: hypothetical protein JNK58_10930 [Phycisphaerae bacterium]|nr:hypothetical protein [Phycisphaerae bacterium]
MLNLPRIARLSVAGDFERMLEEVTRNGRPLPLPVRLRLSEPAGLPAAAAGLALQRITQLTYRPTPVSIGVARALVALRDDSGLFGTLAATAVALAGLLAFSDQVRSLPGTSQVDPELRVKVDESIAAALHRLHRAQEESPAARLGERPTLIGDELDSAIALWQLGLDPRFASAVRFEDLLASVEDRGMRHDRATGALLERVSGGRSDEHRDESRSKSAA